MIEMKVTDTILNAIKEIAIEKRISENRVDWHQIAIYLANKIDSKSIKTDSSLIDQDNDIDTVGNCANCGVEYHIHKTKI